MANNGTFEILNATLKSAPSGSAKYVNLFVQFEVDKSDGSGTINQNVPIKVFGDLCKGLLELKPGQKFTRIVGALGRNEYPKKSGKWQTDLSAREIELA